jgi:hypothetical protein
MGDREVFDYLDEGPPQGGGRERTLAEFRALFADAGFQLEQAIATPVALHHVGWAPV